MDKILVNNFTAVPDDVEENNIEYVSQTPKNPERQPGGQPAHYYNQAIDN
jgi:hypothetical protein